jgi:hypothetical protein
MTSPAAVTTLPRTSRKQAAGVVFALSFSLFHLNGDVLFGHDATATILTALNLARGAGWAVDEASLPRIRMDPATGSALSLPYYLVHSVPVRRWLPCRSSRPPR